MHTALVSTHVDHDRRRARLEKGRQHASDGVHDAQGRATCERYECPEAMRAQTYVARNMLYLSGHVSSCSVSVTSTSLIAFARSCAHRCGAMF
jgi:hypothetical protein